MTQVPATGVALDRIVNANEGDAMPSGSRVVMVEAGENGASVTVLTPGFEACGRASLSFDATRLLFVGRRQATEDFGVWELNLLSRAVRRVVTPPRGADRAFYLSTLYTMQSDRPQERLAFRSPDARGRRQLFSCGQNGEDIQQITFAPDGVSDAIMLSDGRLLIGMNRMPEHSAGEKWVGGTAWFTINIDGTDLFPFAAVHEPPRSRTSPAESRRDDAVLYLEHDRTVPGSPATIIRVPRTHSLTEREVVGRFDAGNLQSLAVSAGGTMLVSHHPKGLRSAGIYELLPDDDRESTGVVFDDPDWHECDVVAVAARRQPPGRSSVVAPGHPTGRLYCLNAYLSDDTVVAEPAAPGQIRYVRFLTPAGTPDGQASVWDGEANRASGGDVLIGGCPVEADGSFSVELPARQPFRVETLDAQHRVLQSMRSWMWVMPMERRGCIGCHEDRALTPPNRHVTALRQRPHRIGLAGVAQTGEGE